MRTNSFDVTYNFVMQKSFGKTIQKLKKLSDEIFYNYPHHSFE